jgi:Cof subfamily protein (haloacid dehalogenase superfamily)
MQMTKLPKAVFSDVDGTLLNKEREISAFTAEQIQNLVHNHNTPFVMVTARMPMGVERFYKSLNMNTPVVCYNGALVLSSFSNGWENNVWESHTLTAQYSLEVAKIALSQNLHCSIYSGDTWVANAHDEWTVREENNTQCMATVASIIELLSGWIDSGQGIHKIMIMGSPLSIDFALEKINHLPNNEGMPYRSKDTYLEITPKSVSKADGVKAVLSKLELSLDEAIAFGDNYNDIDMLKAVGTGYAMENAPSTVKQYAKHIAPANTNNGVAQVLLELMQ